MLCIYKTRIRNSEVNELPLHAVQFRVLVSATNSINNIVQYSHAQVFSLSQHWRNHHPLVDLWVIPRAVGKGREGVGEERLA